MYISELKLWNFRKYHKDGVIETNNPHLVVPFSKGLNVLIGENDSGKTTIIDAIKLILKTHSVEWIKIEDNDFFQGSNELRIELIITELNDAEAAKFNGKLAFANSKFYLHLRLDATRKDNRVLPYEVVALQGEEEESLNATQKDFLKVTYLKALRDADNELSAKKGSRISQILLGHDTFKERGNGKSTFESIFSNANDDIKKWFEEVEDGKQIKSVIDTFIHCFISDNMNSKLDIAPPQIRSILEKLSITIQDALNLGLGTQNRLYMAAELLHLQNDTTALHTCLVEELEAHLHPQAQMKVIETLQDKSNNGIQFIMTTHSPNLSSKIKLNGVNTTVILCKNNDVYPLTKGKTKLAPTDYEYLDHFLDVTKSNLFFAKGVIIVEGMAEEILLPALAKNLGKSFTQSEVSIVNVGSTAYLHFARILMRNDGKQLNYPVAVVTDADVRPDDKGEFNEEKENQKIESIIEKLEPNDYVKLFLATHWTLEWCLFKSNALSDMFMRVCRKVHSRTEEFKSTDENDFEKGMIEKLQKRKKSGLDKVGIATLMALEIDKLNEPINYTEDDTAMYLIEAINHVCK